MSNHHTPRRPLSPWPVGALILAVFLVLAVRLGSSNLAAQILAAAALLIVALIAFRRQPGKDREQSNAAAPIETTPNPQPRSSQALTSHELPAVLTIEEAAAYLRADVSIVASELEAGHLPGNRLGGSWRLPKRDLDEWLAGDYRYSVGRTHAAG